MSKPNYEKCLYCGCHRIYRLTDGTYEHYCYPPQLTVLHIAFPVPCERRLSNESVCEQMRAKYKENQKECEKMLKAKRGEVVAN